MCVFGFRFNFLSFLHVFIGLVDYAIGNSRRYIWRSQGDEEERSRRAVSTVVVVDFFLLLFYRFVVAVTEHNWAVHTRHNKSITYNINTNILFTWLIVLEDKLAGWSRTDRQFNWPMTMPAAYICYLLLKFARWSALDRLAITKINLHWWRTTAYW